MNLGQFEDVSRICPNTVTQQKSCEWKLLQRHTGKQWSREEPVAKHIKYMHYIIPVINADFLLLNYLC